MKNWKLVDGSGVCLSQYTSATKAELEAISARLHRQMSRGWPGQDSDIRESLSIVWENQTTGERRALLEFR